MSFVTQVKSQVTCFYKLLPWTLPKVLRLPEILEIPDPTVG